MRIKMYENFTNDKKIITNFKEISGKLVGNFKFKSQTELASFLKEVAKHADKVKHHPDCRIYKATQLEITLFTHDKNEITELDYQFANFIDSLEKEKMYENHSDSTAMQSARGTINDIVKKRVTLIKKFKSDVEDCFVELLDNHFLVDVNVTNNNNRNSGYFRCDISIYKDVERGDQAREFNFIDIKEYVMMFESYINEYEYDLLKYDLPGVVKDFDLASGNYVKIGVWIKL